MPLFYCASTPEIADVQLVEGDIGERRKLRLGIRLPVTLPFNRLQVLSLHPVKMRVLEQKLLAENIDDVVKSSWVLDSSSMCRDTRVLETTCPGVGRFVS